MQCDYYAFKQVELSDSLNNLEQAAQKLEEAKKQRDKDAQKQAMKKAAVRAAEIESYLAYLWFEARGSELANSIRNAWQEALVATSIPRAFYVLPDASAISYLPPLSFALHIPFQLQKPYLSKDDCAFHLLDNPVRKDKVFQAPMVASTSWKGALRAALWQLGHKADHPVTIRLLGNPRESEEQQAGRLYFFPTFFDPIGLEVINPHDRNTGVGARGPILMECVPSGTKGAFLVLYVPFGTFGQGEVERRAEIAEDLQVLCMGVQSMLTTYGFGAKTSSGFGTAELVGEGRLTIRAALDGGLASSAPIAPPQPELPRYLETPTRLHTDLRRADGTLKSEVEYQDLIESRGQKFSKKDKQLYDKAKRWWEDKGQALTQAPEPEPESAPLEPPPVSVYTFHSWEELHQAVQSVAELLKGGTA